MKDSLTDYSYSCMDNGTKVCHFLQGIKINELEAAVNVVGAQSERYGMDFDTAVFYLCQIIVPSFHIAQVRNKQVRPKVVAFMGKVECKKYPQAVWISRTEEQHMQARSCTKNSSSPL